jgi:type IV secretion system protein VirD4
MSVFIKCIQFVFSLIGDFLLAIVDVFSKSEGLNAAFGSERLIASRWNQGFVISKNRKLTRLKSYENILLSGPTGSGKTSRYLLKNLYTLKNCSLLINDPQKELIQLASGYMKDHFNILTINFSDSSVSAGFNPFSRIKKANDVHKLADLLIATTLEKGNGDVFWKLASVNLTQVLIRILLYQSKEYHNIANLIRLLHFFAVDPSKVDAWVANTNDEKLIIDYKGIIATPEKTLQNVVASVKAALQLFDDPQIARTTAYDTIDFEELRKIPTAIFLNNTLGDQRYISILNSIFFEQFYAFALETIPKKDELSIFVILEECASLYIPMLPQVTATCRKARVGNLLTVQAHAQLKSFYKDQAENIKANCRTKIHLTGQTSMEELKEIETLSGKYIYKDEKGVERAVPLITTDAIRMLPENRSLIISGHHPIIKGRSSPYYRSMIFSEYAKIPPISLKSIIPDEPIPMLK